MDSSDFIMGAFGAACLVGFLALAAAVRMQDRLAELKTELDAAVAERKETERQLAQVTNALELVTGLNTIQRLVNPPYVGRASIPDIPACPVDDTPGADAAWVDEMRARWATDTTPEQ